MKILRALIDNRNNSLYNHPMKRLLFLLISFFGLFVSASLLFAADAPSNSEVTDPATVSQSVVNQEESQPKSLSAQEPVTIKETVSQVEGEQSPIDTKMMSIGDKTTPSEESASPKVENKIVKAIEIKGNKTISIATILAKIKTRVGEEYIQNVISDDLKRLYNTGYFADVSVDREDFEGGFRVIIYLVEKPIVDKITFTKTKYFNSRTLLQKLKTKEGRFLDNKTLKEDIDTLKDLYSKKGIASVSADVETDVDKITNKAKLHFIIEEGSRAKVTKIKFNGNKAFRYAKLMKVIKTRSAWLFNPGYLKEDVIKEDIERLKSFYEKEGFIDAVASYTLQYPTKSQIIVVIDITEGNRYYTGKIAVENNKIFSQEEVLSAMKDIRVGKVFSREKLDVDIANIHTLYFDKGYIFANVKESTSLNPDTGKVEIKLDIQEGDLAYVNKVKIQGNTHTRDIVVRREIRLHPGDQFDGEKLKRSKERLKNLGYFEDIGYDIEDTDTPNKKDLVVQVKEAKTGSLSFGGGYSTVDKVVGFVEVEQKNFDFANWPTFTGGGQDLSVHAEAGSVRNNQRLSFTEPWIFDYPISGGFDLYRSKHLRESSIGYGYDEQRIGGDLRFGKELSEYLSAGATYRLEEVTIGNLPDGATNDLVSELGKNTVSSLALRLTRDTRDNVFGPTKGLLLSGTTEVAGGPFAGDKDFLKFEGKSSYDVPLPYSSVLEFRLRGGLVNSYGDSTTVPIFERFFAGGAYTIRGYNERKVGPIDPATEDPIGGESMLVGNVEFTVPLVDFIKFATFFDAGNVWSKVGDFGQGGYKAGTGLGLRVKTPIGPINLDYGYPLNSEVGEDTKSGKFYFSISRGF